MSLLCQYASIFFTIQERLELKQLICFVICKNSLLFRKGKNWIPFLCKVCLTSISITSRVRPLTNALYIESTDTFIWCFLIKKKGRNTLPKEDYICLKRWQLHKSAIMQLEKTYWNGIGKDWFKRKFSIITN